MKIHLIFAPTVFQLNHGDLGKGIDPPLWNFHYIKRQALLILKSDKKIKI